MSNKYYSSYASIIPGEGCMYNEATTFNNNHIPKTMSINNNTNQITVPTIKKKYNVSKSKSKKCKKK